MKIKFVFYILIFNQYFAQNCPEKINILPMYGEVQKCEEQIESDKIFISEMDKLFTSRKDAANDKIKSAWEYFYKKDYETSMKRFNQAWLLYPDLYEIYWGFANIRGNQGNSKEAKKYFDIAKEFNPTNSNFFVSSAMASSNIYLEEKNTKFLYDAISDLEEGLKIDSKNARLYYLLSVCNYYLNDIKTARKYLKKAENLDSDVVKKEYKEMLDSK